MIGFAVGLIGAVINIAAFLAWDSVFNLICGLICLTIGLFCAMADA